MNEKVFLTEDLVSREEVKERMIHYGFTAPDMTVTEFVEDELHAADVEPVRRGRWKPLFESEITGWNPAFAGCDPIGAYVCSCCNSEATYTCDDEFDLSNYCPNCGAKMDLEGEKNDK